MQATPLLQPPYSLALNDYQGPASKLRVQLLLRDLTKPSLEVYISLRLSGFGVELQTNPSVAALNTFVLQPGVPLTISGSELSPLFAQMLAQGVNYDELLAGASLPGGYYTWEVVAYLPDGRQVSNTGRASMSVFKAQPPQITFPANQTTVAATGIGTVPFQWISRSTSPASVLGTIYDLKIYELPDEVTDPNVAVLSGLLPVFNTQTASTSYFYGPGDPLLQPGKRYAIVVQAQDIGGGDSYENQGLSQVVAFKVAGEADAAAQAACPAPTGLNIRQDDARTLEVSWNPVAEANDYLLQFRKANEPWQSQTTTDNGLMLIQLSTAKYEVQVATRCNGGLVSTVSPIVNYEIGIAPKDSTADEIEDVLSYYNEDEETPEPAVYEEAEETYRDPLDDLILTVTYTDTTGKERTYTSLPPNPTTEQLKQATVAIKPQCVALSSGYSCGIHDNPAAPAGAEYMPKAGDELAMGSTMMEVVKIDGSGNGLGIATVKAFNNAKFGVEFKGIKVREGGCIYAGEAITKSLDFALLSRTQREELAKYYAAYNTLLTAADSLAPEIAKGMNTMLDALKSKKAATRALLEENDITKLPDILINCTDIATQSQATQDSLQKLYCGLQAGTIKGYKKADIKAALNANIEFMNKLGPALKECNPANNFTPWEEKDCKGPCVFAFERYVVSEECMDKLASVFGDPVRPMSVITKAWNVFLSNYHVIRANEFAVRNNIDNNDIFETSFDNKDKLGTSQQVIIYQIKKDSDGNNIELKHVFKQHKSGVSILTSSDNDDLNQTWNNYWSEDGQPILNESDLSEPITDVSGLLPVGGASKVAAGVKLAGSASKSWAVYTFMTTSGRYYGMTVDYTRRLKQHGARIIGGEDEMIKRIADKLTARGIEQLFINYGLKTKIITKQINSINPKRTERYREGLKKGEDFLKKIMVINMNICINNYE